MGHDQAGTDQCTRTNRPGHGAGRGRGSNATTSCAPASSNVSVGGGHPSRLPATWPKRQGGRDLLREYLPVHLRPGRPAQEPRLEALSATGEVEARQTAAREAVRPPSSRTADRSPNAPRRRLTARPLGTGRRIRCCLGGPGRWCSPCTSAARASCSWRGCLRKRRGRSPRPSPGCWGHCPRHFARRLPSTMGPSSPATTAPRPRHRDLLLRHLLAVAEGGSRNAIGRLRRFLPRKMNPEVPEERFTEVALAYNNTPRKCLGYRSSAEIFKTRVLHFKCEFTFPRSRE